MDLKSLYQRAKKAMTAQRYSSALGYFRLISQLDPEIGSIHYNIGSCYYELKQYQAAFDHYVIAARLENDAITCFNLGVVSEKLNNRLDAKEFYQKAIVLDAHYFDAHYNLALLLLDSENVNQAGAEEHLRKCLALKPNDEVVQFQLARFDSNIQVSHPPSAHIASLFDAYADHYDTHLLNHLHYALPQEIASALLQEVGLHRLKQLSALDLGCGTGLVAEYLDGKLKCFDGVDLSQKMLQLADSKGYYRKLSCSDIESFLNTHSEVYSIVTAADVFNYCGNLNSVFSQLSSCVSPGGILIFSLEKGDDMRADYTLQLSGRYLHNMTYIRRLLDESGFNLLNSYDIPGRSHLGNPVIQTLCISEKN